MNSSFPCVLKPLKKTIRTKKPPKRFSLEVWWGEINKAFPSTQPSWWGRLRGQFEQKCSHVEKLIFRLSVISSSLWWDLNSWGKTKPVLSYLSVGSQHSSVWARKVYTITNVSFVSLLVQKQSGRRGGKLNLYHIIEYYNTTNTRIKMSIV